VKKIFRAARVVPAVGHVLENGAVLVVNGRVAAIGNIAQVRRLSGRDCSEEDFGDAVIFPGLVNAHCHLDYTFLRGALLPQPSFSTWLDRVGRLKRTISKEDIVASIERGLSEAISSGTTSLYSIASFPEVLPRLPPAPLRVWWFYELSDLRNRLHPDDLIEGALMFFDHPKRWQGGFGLSPHAPYSASRPLYELTKMCSGKYEMPWCTHVAESSEEFQMFQAGRGQLHNFLSSMGRDMSDTGNTSPLRSIFGDASTPGGCLLVHLNYLDEPDWEILARWGRHTHVVHCPSSHRFFAHQPFDFRRLQGCGARIAIGTDSGATGGTMDLRKEMRIFSSSFPEVPVLEIWRMVTEIPSAFLGNDFHAGNLRSGSPADFCVFNCPQSIGREDMWRFLMEDFTAPAAVYVGAEPGSGKPFSSTTTLT
jgi:cytosine/adenosine deaminase-related metal-dependent hydrolase